MLVVLERTYVVLAVWCAVGRSVTCLLRLSTYFFLPAVYAVPGACCLCLCCYSRYSRRWWRCLLARAAVSGTCPAWPQPLSCRADCWKCLFACLLVGLFVCLLVCLFVCLLWFVVIFARAANLLVCARVCERVRSLHVWVSGRTTGDMNHGGVNACSAGVVDVPP